MALFNQTDYAAIKGALVTWANLAVGVNKTLWENTVFPRLAKPYATLQIMEMGRDRGIDQRDVVDNAGVAETTYTGLREMVLRVRVFADPPGTLDGIWAQELLQTMLLALSVQSVIDTFRPLGIASLSHTPITGRDVQNGDRWEWVAESDVRVSYRSTLFDDGLAPPPDDGGFIESTDVTINTEPTFPIDSTP